MILVKLLGVLSVDLLSMKLSVHKNLDWTETTSITGSSNPCLDVGTRCMPGPLGTCHLCCNSNGVTDIVKQMMPNGVTDIVKQMMPNATEDSLLETTYPAKSIAIKASLKKRSVYTCT